MDFVFLLIPTLSNLIVIFLWAKQRYRWPTNLILGIQKRKV